MLFDLHQISNADTYKMITNLVVPRPIALVTSLSADGKLNAAPFSFFNMVGSCPPMAVLGLARLEDGSLKDTDRNISATGEYVINIVTDEIAEKMNVCAVDFAYGVNELGKAELTPERMEGIKVPRIAESVASLGLRHMETLDRGKNRIILGEVVKLFVRDDVVNPANFHIDARKVHALGRLGSPSAYCRTHDRFEMPRENRAQWAKRTGRSAE
jgi:flavin reductase (DIM6/NTAB) family NADH-FMN oxidoreductase RutF